MSSPWNYEMRSLDKRIRKLERAVIRNNKKCDKWIFEVVDRIDTLKGFTQQFIDDVKSSAQHRVEEE